MSNKAGKSSAPRNNARKKNTQPKKEHSRKGAHVGNVVLAMLLVLWLCLIWFNSSRPADVSSQESGWLLSLAHKVFPSLTEHALRKSAHAFEFAILGILSSLLFLLRLKIRNTLHRYMILRSGGWLIAFGLAAPIVDEAIQLFVPGRSAEVLDVLIDLGGFAAGALLTSAIFYLCFRLGRKKTFKPGK